MTFGGGYPPQGGGGAVTSQEKVYLVLWGSQWGTQSGSFPALNYSGDSMGIVPDLEAFFSGLGTNNELWSAVATQYCDGIAAGSVSCPVSAAHVAYPSGGVLAGVWEDTSATPATGPPGSTTTPAISGAAIAQEGADAATHFGDTSPSAQFVVISPPGTNPDHWMDPRTGFCAYHDNTGDGWGVSGPDVAYTNLPYVTDGRCWQGTVNSPGLLDGVTIIEGHEYYETITDPFFSPSASGWIDAKGREIGDKCLGLNPGLPGAPIDLTLATGTFAVQGMWSNDAKKKGDCAVSHSPVLVTTPAKQLTTVLSSVSLQVGALDVLPGQTLSYSAAGLPGGLSINPVSGLISGTATTRGHSVVTVTASDGTYSHAVSFKWTVKR
jgi:serine protease